MSKAVTVRDVPDDVVAELAARARRDGRSLQEYLRLRLVDLAARPDVNDWASAVRDRAEAANLAVSVDDILQARDADRR